jgi:hypothetical protein
MNGHGRGYGNGYGKGGRVEGRELGRKHLRFAQFCEQLAIWLSVLGGRWLCSWALVALHYAALHYIDAYLVGVCGIESHAHTDQDQAIAADHELVAAGVGARYRELRALSEASRYRMQGYTRSEFADYRRQYFQPVKSALVGLITRAHLASQDEAHHQPELMAAHQAMEEHRDGRSGLPWRYW